MTASLRLFQKSELRDKRFFQGDVTMSLWPKGPLLQYFLLCNHMPLPFDWNVSVTERVCHGTIGSAYNPKYQDALQQITKSEGITAEPKIISANHDHVQHGAPYFALSAHVPSSSLDLQNGRSLEKTVYCVR